MTVKMFDSVDISTVPDGPAAVAGYVGGNWPTFIPLVQRFPHARHLSIAVNAGENAECLDIEAGDAIASEAPAWVKRQLSRGVHRPVVYTSVSNAATVLGHLRNGGIARETVRLWCAHYDGEHICTPRRCGLGLPTTADATQWTLDALGRNLDESLCSDTFFAPPPPFIDTAHYARFANDSFPYGKHGARTLRERAVVQRRDHLVGHAKLHALELRGLHDELVFLRKRVWFEAVKQHPQPDGKPSWGEFERGWRYHQLELRTQ